MSTTPTAPHADLAEIMANLTQLARASRPALREALRSLAEQGAEEETYSGRRYYARLHDAVTAIIEARDAIEEGDE